MQHKAKEMTSHCRMLRVSFLLAAGFSGLAGAAVPVSTFKQVMPPPGLYRIDQDGTMRMPDVDSSFRQREDGATGDVATATTTPHGSYARDFKGQGPNNFCVPVRNTGMVLPPSLSAAACKTISTTGDANGIVHIAQCSMGRVKLTVRRLGDDTWEFINEADVKVGGVPDMNAMKPMLETMAKHGKTAEERDQARQMLATLPQQQAQMDTQIAEVKASMAKELANARTPEEAAAIRQAMTAMQAGGGGRMQAASRALWTRISHTCQP